MKLPVTPDRPFAALGRCVMACAVVAIALGAPPAVARSKVSLAPAMPAGNGPAADFPVVLGAPYQVGDQTFSPSDTMNYDTVGYASVAGDAGYGVTAAHHTLPLPSYVEVTSLDNGRTVLVRVERRGPMDGTQAIELSPGAAAQLGIAENRHAAVRVRRVNPPESERALLRAGGNATERMPTPKPLLAVLMRKLTPNAPVSIAGPVGPKDLPDGDDADMAPAPRAVASYAAPPAAGAPYANSLAVKAPPRAAARPIGLPATSIKPRVQGSFAVAGAPAAGKSGTTQFSQAFALASPAAPSARTRPAAPLTVEARMTLAKPAPVRSMVAKPAAAEPVAAGGTHLVQVGAYSLKGNAAAVANRLGGSLSPAGKLWRVRMGPYSGQRDAEAALAKAKSAGYSDARIQRAD